MSPAQLRTCIAVACALLFVVSAALLPWPALAAQTPAFAATDVSVAQGGAVTYEANSSPTMLSVSPPRNATGVQATATVNALFAEALDAATVTGANFTLRDGANPPVAATVSYDAVARRVILVPVNPLADATTYTARLAAGITDALGNPLGADFTWSFTTAAPLGPPPTQGPGGPILVISDAARPFSTYYAEILRAEGLNLFAVQEISTVDAGLLGAYQVAILGEVDVSPAQAAMLSAWVNAGGNLIAMRPDADLLPLLGLTAAGGTLAEGYFLVDTATSPGAGIVGETMQFHGTADRYALNGAGAVAMLYSDTTTPTVNPAVTLHSVGTNGGQVAAFAFDLARSVVQTRQGNPAWAGQERDGAVPKRSNDLFFGPAVADPRPDWVNFARIAIPQADEAQRLLANLITSMNTNQMPLPRFWYFPRGEKAVVVMTHDDHSGGDIVGRLTNHNAASQPGCVVNDWACVRSTIYAYGNPGLDDAQLAAFQAQGHEFAVHVDTSCLDFTPGQLATAYADDIAAFAWLYPSAGVPQTQRTHCIAFSDWASQPLTELANGIRLDTNYYYWPAAWILDRPGLFTGSGMPMRFANVDGAMIDVYQAATQMSDEAGQSYPATVNTLLDRALGAEGYYGAFVSNQHTEGGSSGANVTAIVAAAQARDVPIISARQLLTWVDGRNGSSFANLSYTGNMLTFAINVGDGANGLMAMLPERNGTQLLSALTRGGAPVDYTVSTVKGVAYAQFAAASGAYAATYADDTTAPTVTAFAPPQGATTVSTNAIVSATFSEPINAATLTEAAFALRDGANNVIPATLAYNVATRTATLTPNAALAVNTAYTAMLTTALEDIAGNALAADQVWSFATTAVTYNCPCSLWGSTGGAGSFVDTNAYDLGVRFKSVVDGSITGIRFYRAILGGGPFVVTLWSNDGVQLASATLNAVTTTGWQEVLFPAPVAITAGTLYMASYYAPQGGYSFTPNAFATDFVNGPLVAVATGAPNGPNGANAIGGGFPTAGGGGNYWVDVLFATVPVADTIPPTIIQRTPAPAASGVAVDDNVIVRFSEDMQAATLTAAAFVLRDSANNVIPATLTYDSGTQTATLNPTSNLAYESTYQATVAGSVTDLSDNALGAPVTWSFTTMQAPPPPPPGDDTLADFSAGAAGACYVAQAANGEIILAPTVGTEFSGATLPAGWDSYVWQTGGAATFNGAVARVDDAIIATLEPYFGPGRAIEFVATFAAANSQHVGFGVDVYSVLYWAMFSTGGTGQGLYARTNNNGAEVNTLLGNAYIGAPHRYRIEWGASAISFYIDGALVHTQNVAITRTMRPLISDFNSNGPALVVDWLHMSPYGSPCTFTSRVIDANAKKDWLLLSSTGDRPVGTGVAFLTRTGDSAVPDGSWSAWQAVGGDGAVASPDGRYIQYQAQLSTTNPDVTPEVASVAISNAPSDLPPVADDLTITTAEETPAAVTLHAVDPEAGALTYAFAQPSHGTLSGIAPNLTYTPDLNYNGSDSFTYTANDGKANSNTATVNITVTPVNDAPVLAAIGGKSINEEVQLAFTASATDVDLPANTLAFSLVGAPAGANIDAQSGAFTWTPTEAQGPGSFTFSVRVADNGNPILTDEESITVVVAEVNIAPVADADSYSTPEDTALVVTAPGVLDGDSDVDGNALTAHVVTAPAHGQLVLSPDGSFTYTPAAEYSGSDSFTYVARDGAADSNVATVSITVVSVNDAPVLAAIGNQASVEGATINLATSAFDAEANTLTFSATGLPPSLSINSASGAITGDVTFAAAANSPYAVTVSVSDGQGGTDSESFNWAITDFNRAPVATNRTATTMEDTPVAIVLVATDADADDLTYTVTPPSHGTLSGSGANRTYAPAANYSGNDSFTYVANDGKADSNTATVNITVTPVNDAPVLAPIGDQASVEGATVSLQLSASDADGNPLTYNVVGLPIGLTYSTSTGAIGGQISYTAATGSPWNVAVTVSDGQGGTDSESFTWTVTEILPPRFALPTLSGVHGSTINVPLAFTEATDFGGLRFGVRYDPAVLTPVAVTSAGAGMGWSITPNLTESGVVTVSMATVNAVAGDGTLVNLSFTVVGGPGAGSALAFGRVTANGEDVPAARLTDGSFSVPLATVAGAVRFWSDNGAVADATLTLADSDTRTTASATDGAFSFANVAGGAWTLTPSKADGARGISALDASLVLQSRAGLRTLTPAEALAADINESGAVDENDAIAVLRVAVRLATLPLSPGAHVWRFLPAERTYAPLLADQANQDFSAVLLGDVSGSWTPPPRVAAAPDSAADATLDTAADAGAVADAAAATLTIDSVAAPDGDSDLIFTLKPAATPVHAVDLLLRYDTSRLEIISAQVAQEAGQMAAVNLSQAGVARIGLASITPLPDGRLIATVRVRGADPLAALLKVEATGDERPIQVVYWAQSPVRIYLPMIDK